jgi:hypothetical protein
MKREPLASQPIVKSFKAILIVIEIEMIFNRRRCSFHSSVLLLVVVTPDDDHGDDEGFAMIRKHIQN